MYHVLKGAYDRTPVADRGKLMADLGATIEKERTNKKGKIIRKYNYAPKPVVYAIVNKLQKKKGANALVGDDMEKAAKALIVRRLRAIGSLRAGWTAALKKVGQTIAKSFLEVGPKVKTKSLAWPAQDGWNPVAKAEYRLTVERARGGDTGRTIHPLVVDALEDSFAKEHSEMVLHLKKKLGEIAKEAKALQ